MGHADAERESFGSLLRAHRLAAGYGSQEALGAASGVALDTIGAIERGVIGKPQRNTLSRLIEALRLDGDDLVAFEAAAGRPGHTARGGKMAPRVRKRARSGDVSDLEREAVRAAEGSRTPPASPTLSAAGLSLPPLAPPPIAGRAEVVARLMAHVEGDRAALLAIGAPSGGGVSRLLDEVALQARAAGFNVVAGAWRDDHGPYGAIAEALAQSIAQVSPSEVVSWGRFERDAWLAAVVPARPLVDRTGEWWCDRSPIEEATIRTGLAVTDHLSSQARSRGHVLLLDGIHRATRDALALLTILIHDQPDRPVRLIAGYERERADVPHDRDVMLSLRDVAGEEAVIDVPLDPLPEAAGLEVLDACLSDIGWVGRVTRERMVAQAAGSPLPLVLVAEALRRRPEGVDAPSMIGDVDRLVRLLVRALPRGALLVVEMAVIAGRPTETAVLADAANRTADDVRVAMAAARSLGLIVEGRGATYAVAHERVGAVVRRGMTADRRAEAHRLLARALACTGDPDHVYTIAHHNTVGYPHGTTAPPDALRTLEWAGDAALAQYGYASAQAYYDLLRRRLEGTAHPRDIVRVREKLVLTMEVRERCDAFLRDWLRASPEIRRAFRARITPG